MWLLLVVYRISGRINEILLSLTYEFTDIFVIMEGRSFVSMLKKSGDKINHCGTLCVTFSSVDLLCPIFTYCFRFVRKPLCKLW